MVRSINMRVDKDFEKMLREVAGKRVALKKDKFTRPTSQLTKAMMKHRNFPQILKDLEDVEK